VSAAVPIPANLWRKMLAFMEAGYTGQALFDVRNGHIEGLRLTEFVRPDPRAPLPALDELPERT
jgi:hypothetical protein